MRERLVAVAGGAILLAACGGGGNSSGTTSSGTGGTTGAATTSGGSSTGKPLRDGLPCSANSQCASDICGLDGTGNCCANSCVTDGGCGAVGCDNAGNCIYPDAGTSCGSDFCGADLFTLRRCNGGGACVGTAATPCSGNLGCNGTGNACNTSCSNSKDCAGGYVCNDGGCVGPQTIGQCTEDDDCYSGHCGINGIGHCCLPADAGCVTGDVTCGATDCNASNGLCNYADAGTACGSVPASCSNDTQQNPSVCDGKGTCPTPVTAPCDPFICGATACLTACTDDTSCGSNDFCDLANHTCCDPLPIGGTIAVNATEGNDAVPCCSLGGHTPCQTIHQVMTLIDDAKAKDVTIKAVVLTGHTWNPQNEVYPIVLGWGAELSAPGIYFFAPADGGAEVIDIDNFSANDTVGYASLVGAAGNVVTVGPDEFGDQSIDTSMIQIESGNTLYIANASVNGSYQIKIGLDEINTETTAITVTGGGSLTLGQDQSAGVTGTVTIGNSANDTMSDGWKGIVCGVANGKGCTISDATLKGGKSSVVIQSQLYSDIDAEDYAAISLTSNPVIGIPPADAGFLQCPSNANGSSEGKPDVSDSQGGLNPDHGAAVLLHGLATMTFNNGTVQCIAGDAFDLTASANGSPALTLDSTTIQNTEYGINAAAGTATVTNSNIQYNFNGVQQGTDGTNLSSINLSGDGGTTTVACSSSYESVSERFGLPGVSVLNSTSAPLDANNVDWDTPGPDLFQCDPTFATCTCEISSCTVNPSQADAGLDGLDAVETSTGSVTTTGNGLSPLDCSAPGRPNPTVCDPPCVGGDICCTMFLPAECEPAIICD